MSNSIYGMAAAIVFVAGVGACSVIDRGSNYQPAKASVFLIDRSCNFIETGYEDGKKVARGVTDSCNSTDEWASVRKKRDKVVSGKAVVHLSYTAPQDGSAQTGKLNFDGRDDEFYELKAGDELQILVRNDDPARFVKA